MGKSKPTPHLTVEEYLEFEESSSEWHEYVCGQIFAMSGATEAHHQICSNFHVWIAGLLKGSGCRVLSQGMKVQVKAVDSIYYPDIVVTCEPYSAKSVVKNSPTILIEVLSPSTQHIDRREKLVAYKQLESLQYYIIAHQSRMLLEVHRRTGPKAWELERLMADDELVLEILDKDERIAVMSLYENSEVTPIVSEADDVEYTCELRN